MVRFFSLIKQKCQAEYNDRNQTPQFEGGNMDMVVFDFFDTGKQLKELLVFLRYHHHKAFTATAIVQVSPRVIMMGQ